MPYGYLGQNTPNQTINNSGVFSITDVAELQSQGKLGGSLELIDTISFSSGVSTVSATNLQEDKYDVHLVHFKNFQITTSGGGTCQTNFQLAENGTFTTSGYQRAVQGGNSNGTNFQAKSTSDTRIFNAYSTGNGQDINFSLYMYIYNAGNSSKYTFITTQLTKYEAGIFQYQFGGGVLPTASKVTGVRAIESVGGTYDSFEVKVYGVKQI
jgi:hypothetical protein